MQNIALLAFTPRNRKQKNVGKVAAEAFSSAGHFVYLVSPKQATTATTPFVSPMERFGRLIVFINRKKDVRAAQAFARRVKPIQRLSIGRVTPKGFREARDLKNLLVIK